MPYLRQVCPSSADAKALMIVVIRAQSFLPRFYRFFSGLCPVHWACVTLHLPQLLVHRTAILIWDWKRCRSSKLSRVAPRNICVCLSEVFSFCLGVLYRLSCTVHFSNLHPFHLSTTCAPASWDFAWDRWGPLRSQCCPFWWWASPCHCSVSFQIHYCPPEPSGAQRGVSPLFSYLRIEKVDVRSKGKTRKGARLAGQGFGLEARARTELQLHTTLSGSCSAQAFILPGHASQSWLRLLVSHKGMCMM